MEPTTALSTEDKKNNYFLKIVAVVGIFLSSSLVIILILMYRDLHQQLLLKNSQLEILNSSTQSAKENLKNHLLAQDTFDLLKQINEIPKDLTFKDTFKCMHYYQIKEDELSDFESKMYTEQPSHEDKKLSIFCKKEGDIVLATYTSSLGVNAFSGSDVLTIYKQNSKENLDYTKTSFVGSDIGSVDLRSMMLIGWNDDEILFAARDTAISQNSQSYLLVYYLDLGSIDFALPSTKVVEVCTYSIAKGTAKRDFISCSKLSNQQKSSFLSEEDLW